MPWSSNGFSGRAYPGGIHPLVSSGSQKVVERVPLETSREDSCSRKGQTSIECLRSVWEGTVRRGLRVEVETDPRR
jgi:hypothetical protein